MTSTSSLASRRAQGLNWGELQLTAISDAPYNALASETDLAYMVTVNFRHATSDPQRTRALFDTASFTRYRTNQLHSGWLIAEARCRAPHRQAIIADEVMTAYPGLHQSFWLF